MPALVTGRWPSATIKAMSQHLRQPLSGAKHFWLSFLAVVSGVPVALMLVSLVSFFFTVLFVILMVAASTSSHQPSSLRLIHSYGDASARGKLVSVPIRGIIVSGTAADPLQTLFGQSYTDGEHVKEQLMALADDETVDGVILEVDSPGGMITASKAIADGVRAVKDASKPIMTHINGMGASGAYWVASATDAIYAEQGSEAGSVGVIMGPLVTAKGIVGYGDIATNEPMNFRYFTAGRSKDIGNPFRDMTADEEAYLNRQLQAEYEKFVSHVAESRGIEAATLKNQIGALAYGTDEAMSLKLIDGERSKEEAYQLLASRANVANDFRVERVDNSINFFSGLFGASSMLKQLRMSEADRSAGRARFCETSLQLKPLVFDGDIASYCK